MIMLMQNLSSSLYSIFQQKEVEYSYSTTMLILLLFAGLDVPYVYFAVTQDVKAACYYTIGVYLGLFVVLSICTLRAIRFIRKLSLRVADFANLKQEKCSLYTMMILFDLCYLNSMLLLTYLVGWYNVDDFSVFNLRLLVMGPAVLLEAVPLLFIMAVHHRSFKEVKVEEKTREEEEEALHSYTPSVTSSILKEDYEPELANDG